MRMQERLHFLLVNSYKLEVLENLGGKTLVVDGLTRGEEECRKNYS